jgi:two-component system chemotaxis response regulator CheB
MNKIRVLIVDDSRMIRDVLTDILRDQPDIEVVGTAADAFEARDKNKELSRRDHARCRDAEDERRDSSTCG